MSPTVLRKDGFKFFFYSREMNEPPHVHVTKGGGAAKLWLDPPELEEIYGFNVNERRAILRIVAEHQDQLLESWHDHFGQEPPRHQR